MSARAYYHARTVNDASIRQRAADVKARTDIVEIARDVVPDLKRAGPLWKGCCPIHSERGPSFTVYPSDQHFHCFGCGAHGDVIELVKRVENIDFMAALDLLEGSAGRFVSSKPRKSREEIEREALEHKADMLLAAGKIWQASRPVRPGDPVARYLTRRGLGAPIYPEALRYHEALKHPETARCHPAMVARVVRGGEFVGVHRTFLELDGDQVVKLGGVEDGKVSLAEIVGGAVRLCFPGEDPEPERLGVAEGIETALAARLLFRVPVWACIDAGKLGAFRIPFPVRHLLIFADKDLPKVDPPRINFPEGAGLYYARKLQQRAAAERIGCNVYLPRLADAKCDFADQLAREIFKARGQQ